MPIAHPSVRSAALAFGHVNTIHHSDPATNKSPDI
jgi:hypothetical protein